MAAVHPDETRLRAIEAALLELLRRIQQLESIDDVRRAAAAMEALISENAA